MDNFDPYDVFLAIATNIPQLLKTGFVLQGHIYIVKYTYWGNFLHSIMGNVVFPPEIKLLNIIIL